MERAILDPRSVRPGGTIRSYPTIGGRNTLELAEARTVTSPAYGKRDVWAATARRPGRWAERERDSTTMLIRGQTRPSRPDHSSAPVAIPAHWRPDGPSSPPDPAREVARPAAGRGPTGTGPLPTAGGPAQTRRRTPGRPSAWPSADMRCLSVVRGRAFGRSDARECIRALRTGTRHSRPRRTVRTAGLLA